MTWNMIQQLKQSCSVVQTGEITVITIYYIWGLRTPPPLSLLAVSFRRILNRWNRTLVSSPDSGPGDWARTSLASLCC